MAHASRTTRPQILAAALRIAERTGPASVTMRHLADEVGVTPMALYHHVRDRRDLMFGMVEQLLADVPAAGGAGLPWPERLRGQFLGLRDLAATHPRTFPLVLDHPHSPELARIRRYGFDALVDAGVPPGHIVRTEAVVWTLQLGFVTREALGAFRNQAPGGVDGDAAAVLALVAHYVGWVVEDPALAHPADPCTWDDPSEVAR